MKPQPKPAHLQFNLPLLDLAPAALPADKDQELTLALVELLVSAASSESTVALETPGGQDDPETDE